MPAGSSIEKFGAGNTDSGNNKQISESREVSETKESWNWEEGEVWNARKHQHLMDRGGRKVKESLIRDGQWTWPKKAIIVNAAKRAVWKPDRISLNLKWASHEESNLSGVTEAKAKLQGTEEWRKEVQIESQIIFSEKFGHETKER